MTALLTLFMLISVFVFYWGIETNNYLQALIGVLFIVLTLVAQLHFLK